MIAARVPLPRPRYLILGLLAILVMAVLTHIRNVPLAPGPALMPEALTARVALAPLMPVRRGQLGRQIRTLA